MRNVIFSLGLVAFGIASLGLLIFGVVYLFLYNIVSSANRSLWQRKE